MVIIQLIINKTFRNKYHEKRLKCVEHLWDIFRQRYCNEPAPEVLWGGFYQSENIVPTIIYKNKMILSRKQLYVWLLEYWNKLFPDIRCVWFFYL